MVYQRDNQIPRIGLRKELSEAKFKNERVRGGLGADLEDDLGSLLGDHLQRVAALVQSPNDQAQGHARATRNPRTAMNHQGLAGH